MEGERTMEVERKLQQVEENFKDYMRVFHKVLLHKIIGYYTEKTKDYMVFIFFETDNELRGYSKERLEQFKKEYIKFLEEETLLPNYIWISGFYFDSDENVQKNFKGNYYLATL